MISRRNPLFIRSGLQTIFLLQIFVPVDTEKFFYSHAHELTVSTGFADNLSDRARYSENEASAAIDLYGEVLMVLRLEHSRKGIPLQMRCHFYAHNPPCLLLHYILPSPLCQDSS